MEFIPYSPSFFLIFSLQVVSLVEVRFDEGILYMVKQFMLWREAEYGRTVNRAAQPVQVVDRREAQPKRSPNSQPNSAYDPCVGLGSPCSLSNAENSI